MALNAADAQLLDRQLKLLHFFAHTSLLRNKRPTSAKISTDDVATAIHSHVNKSSGCTLKIEPPKVTIIICPMATHAGNRHKRPVSQKPAQTADLGHQRSAVDLVPDLEKHVHGEEQTYLPHRKRDLHFAARHFLQRLVGWVFADEPAIIPADQIRRLRLRGDCRRLRPTKGRQDRQASQVATACPSWPQAGRASRRQGRPPS